MDFATLLRELMREREMSGRGLARRVPCDAALISRLASGRQRPSERMARLLDEVLGAGGALAGASLGLAARRAPARWSADEIGDDDVERRALLTAMIAGPVALQLEQIRRHLDGTSGASASERDADEWERVADGYARQVTCSPAAGYLPHLLADAGEITERVISSSGGVRGRLIRSAAQIAALTAVGLSVLGDQRTAARWWRTAARVADESGDGELAALLSGRRAVLALYGAGGDREALAHAGQALAAAGGRSYAGAASAHAARAQAYARLGRPGDARAALADLERVWERLPERDTGAADSEWGQPERRVRHTQSWVLTLGGGAREAWAAQDAALAMYPTNGRGRTQVQMHRVETLIRSGDVDGGAKHCVTVLTALPAAWHRDGMIVASARAALASVPLGLAARPAVRDAREVLALPAGSP